MPRPQIDHLDANLLPWLNPAPGIFSRVLSRDAETGARTALQRIVPSQGYKDQPTAHFHHTSEEILVVKGLMSFDSQMWLTPLSYIYHPPEHVHGFKSSVPVESWFISRVGRDLDFNYVPEPKALSPYFVGETPPSRVLVQAPAVLGGEWERRGRARWRVLSHDPVTGQGSLLLRLDAGSVFDASNDSTEREIIVLEGAVADEHGHFFEPFSAACWPKDQLQPRMTSADGALLYVHFDQGLGDLIERLQSV